MKITFASIAMLASLGLAGGALADDHKDGEGEVMSETAKQFKAGCMDYKAEYGTAADCGCLATKVDEDEEFASEMMMVMGPDDLNGLSQDTLEKIAECEMPQEEM